MIGGNMRRATGSADSAAKVSAPSSVQYDTPEHETPDGHQRRGNVCQADHHRLHLPRHIDYLCQRQCAFMIQVQT
ncbi:hypothetical protein OH693_01915 [Escherichia coli]|nr:hypothetical protein [Escherichia coli]